jgi:biotin carboxyl carrier protein
MAPRDARADGETTPHATPHVATAGEPDVTPDANVRAVISGLVDELVPSLSAALAAAGLAEAEIRRPGWRVRVRRAADATTPGTDADGRAHRRRAADRGGRSHQTDRGQGHDRGRDGGEHRDGQNGSGPAPRDRGRAGRDGSNADPFRAVATSPAVGPFRPSSELRRGARVRAGDRLGVVDVLGVPQEVSAPVDGIVMAVLVDVDDAVEYGQPLVELERASGRPSASGEA